MSYSAVEVYVGRGAALAPRLDTLQDAGLHIKGRNKQGINSIQAMLCPGYERDYRTMQRIEEIVRAEGFVRGSCSTDKPRGVHIQLGWKPYLFGCWENKTYNLHVQASDGRNATNGDPGTPPKGALVSGLRFPREQFLEAMLRKANIRKHVKDCDVLFQFNELDSFARYLHVLTHEQ